MLANFIGVYQIKTRTTRFTESLLVYMLATVRDQHTLRQTFPCRNRATIWLSDRRLQPFGNLRESSAVTPLPDAPLSDDEQYR